MENSACSWKQNDRRKLYLGIKSGRVEEILEELGEGNGLSTCCGAHVFPAFSEATDGHVITFWPLRCKQPIVWNFQGCLLKGGTQMGALWIFNSVSLLWFPGSQIRCRAHQQSAWGWKLCAKNDKAEREEVLSPGVFVVLSYQPWTAQFWLSFTWKNRTLWFLTSFILVFYFMQSNIILAERDTN